jgi:hypothetical protein
MFAGLELHGSKSVQTVKTLQFSKKLMNLNYAVLIHALNLCSTVAVESGSFSALNFLEA